MTSPANPVRRLVAMSIAAALVLAGCGTSGGDTSEDSTTTEATTTTSASPEPDGDTDDGVVTYTVGQCFDPDESSAAAEDIVDCSEEHRFEVVGIIDAPFDQIPPNADDEIKLACADVLDAYLGEETIGDGIQVTNLTLDGEIGDSVAGTSDETLVCIGEAPDGLKLTGSIAGGAAEALEPYVAVLRMEVGDCFELYDDFFYVGVPTSCSDSGALVNLGSFPVAGDLYPGEDELQDLRDEECVAQAQDLDIPNADDASGTVPSAQDWLVGVRVVTCDAPAVTS